MAPSSLGILGERPSRTREVYEALRLAIARRDLQPGNMYSVAELADSFGVSRTPVREALIDLASRGIVKFERNRGVRVMQSTVHDLEEIFQLRLMLEVPATRLAVTLMDERAVTDLQRTFDHLQKVTREDDDLAYWASDRAFHGQIISALGNGRLTEFIDVLRDSILVQGATSAGRTRSLSDITAEHEAIMTKIASGDADGAAEAMRAHLQNTVDLLVRQEVTPSLANGEADRRRSPDPSRAPRAIGRPGGPSGRRR
jgi:DNA-binding GntR family transcriptional regulator